MIPSPDWLTDAILAFNRFVILYFLSLNTLLLCFFALSVGAVVRFMRRTILSDYEQIRESKLSWPISIVVPAQNEERQIVATIRSLMMLRYREFEIVVVNDGSTDGTLRQLIDAFDLRRTVRVYRRSVPTEAVKGIYVSLEYPGLVVVDKAEGGRADALNCGVNVSRYPLFCPFDADSIIEDNALLRLVKPFMDHPEETVASGGIVHIVNGCEVRNGRVKQARLAEDGLPALQTVEYLRSFLAGEVGWSSLQSLLMIAGSFGLYKRQQVLDIGGFSTESETANLDLVVRLHRHLQRLGRPYRIVCVPAPVCWTAATRSLSALRQQRSRRHRGLLRCLWSNRGMLLNPRYGTVGMFAFPCFVLFEVIGPFVEILGYAGLLLAFAIGVLELKLFLLFCAVSVLYGVALSISVILLEELSYRRYPSWLDLVKLMVYGVLENLGYRQLLSIYKIRGFFGLLVSRRGWGRMERSGFGEYRRSGGRTRGITGAE